MSWEEAETDRALFDVVGFQVDQLDHWQIIAERRGESPVLSSVPNSQPACRLVTCNPINPTKVNIAKYS